MKKWLWVIVLLFILFYGVPYAKRGYIELYNTFEPVCWKISHILKAR